jgi:hypothetical protein
MKQKTFKCVQCGECMVQPGTKKPKDGNESRTGCVLFHDHRYARKSPPKQTLEVTSAKNWIGRLQSILNRP